MNAFEVAKQIAALALEFEELIKTAPELRAAMRAMSSHLKTGAALDPAHVDAIRRGLFTDRATGHKMGNQAAYEDFVESLKTDPDWTHVRMDANDFKSINGMHGYKAGDQAITQMGQQVRSAVDSSVGQPRSKLFRLGGDEFHLAIRGKHNAEFAATFIRTNRNALSGLAPFNGTHNWSMSYGVGATPEHADAASLEAKKAKAAGNHPLGQAEHYAHSLLPGSEGPVPIDAPTTRFKIT